MTPLQRTPSLAALNIEITVHDDILTGNRSAGVFSPITRGFAIIPVSPAMLATMTRIEITQHVLAHADPHIRPWAYTDPPAINPATWQLLPKPLARLADLIDNRKDTP